MKSYFATLLLLQAFSASSTVAASKPTEQRRLRGVQPPMEHIKDLDSFTVETISTHNSNHHNNVIDAAYSSSGDNVPRQRKQRRQRKLRGDELAYGYAYGAHSI